MCVDGTEASLNGGFEAVGESVEISTLESVVENDSESVESLVERVGSGEVSLLIIKMSSVKHSTGLH